MRSSASSSDVQPSSADLVLRERPGREVHVRVGEAGHDDAAAEVDDLRRGERRLVHADAARDALARDRERALRRHLRVERADEAVREDHVVAESTQVFDHVTIRVVRSRGRRAGSSTSTCARRCRPTRASLVEWGDFSARSQGRGVTRHLHRRLRRRRTATAVDAWWQRMTDGRTTQGDGEPGPRPQYGDGYYGAFVLRSGRQQRRGDAPRAAARHRGSTISGCAARDVAAAARVLRQRSRQSLGWHPAECTTRTTASSALRRRRRLVHVRRRASRRENVHLAFPRRRRATVAALPRRAIDGRATRQRRARRAARVPPGLLRRVRARPRRPQHRSGLPQPLHGRHDAQSMATPVEERKQPADRAVARLPEHAYDAIVARLVRRPGRAWTT